MDVKEGMIFRDRDKRRMSEFKITGVMPTFGYVGILRNNRRLLIKIDRLERRYEYVRYDPA